MTNKTEREKLVEQIDEITTEFSDEHYASEHRVEYIAHLFKIIDICEPHFRREHKEIAKNQLIKKPNHTDDTCYNIGVNRVIKALSDDK